MGEISQFPASTEAIQIREKDDPSRTQCGRTSETAMVLLMMLLLAGTMAIVVWQTDQLLGSGKDQGQPPLTWPIRVKDLMITDTLELTLVQNNERKLSGRLDVEDQQDKEDRSVTNCQGSEDVNLCLEWPSEKTLKVNYTFDGIGCYDIEWTALRCVQQVFTNCFDVSEAHWYGGYADHHQYWPFENNVREIESYIANDSYVDRIGGVVERYFIASSGVGIYIDSNTPLFFSMNSPSNGTMCLIAKYDKYPYFNTQNILPVLKYKICVADTILDVHKQMSKKFIPRPSGIPSEDLFKYPIWSTWAQYHKNINQSTVIEYAEAILSHNFTHAQIEIDDDWTPAYGDMDFNKVKFPDAKGMINQLSKLGFKVTIWVHPFFNVDSAAFAEAGYLGYLVRELDSPVPAMAPWWDGNLAGILDVSNTNATKWYLQKLRFLQTNYSITSFKFDAGETSWLPHVYSAAILPSNPADNYPTKWTALAAEADPSFRQEVRSGYRTQQYPVFVRMMDKQSNWGHKNALKSIIPGVLTYGLIGYPFVLPDMIGGNAYDNQPDPELYVRWMQLNTFLPSWQYSIVPWIVNDTGAGYSILHIAHKFTELHESIADVLIKVAKETVTTGAPIVRPLWWIAPTDETALTCEDQFLVGDEFMVAPVLEQGARLRDIYFPSGSWDDQLGRSPQIIIGPIWLRNYSVAIDELAYFKRHVELV